jgi:hypothetical protein
MYAPSNGGKRFKSHNDFGVGIISAVILKPYFCGDPPIPLPILHKILNPLVPLLSENAEIYWALKHRVARPSFLPLSVSFALHFSSIFVPFF